ncbi:MAG: hypothetical protein CL878_04135 [Dehalococcoidia bacterium]|nr:hypothetical protein [Dehalococcoidia bacterium]
MLQKTYLVAAREFTANVRTRTFWLGILAVPVVLIISVVILVVLQQRPPTVRQYAVIDHSGWVLPGVEAHAAGDDLARVLTLVQERHRHGGPLFEALPEPLRSAAPALAGADEAQVAAIAAFLARLTTADSATVPVPVRDAAPEIRRWWGELTVKEAQGLDHDLARSQFVRVTSDAGSSDLEATLNRLLDNEEIFGYFVIPVDPLAPGVEHKYVANNLANDSLRDWFRDQVTKVIAGRRVEEAVISPEIVGWIDQPLRIREQKVTAEDQEVVDTSAADESSFTGRFYTIYPLLISIMIVASKLLSNTVEEKSNRIIEVLLSSVAPLELMAGKILGIAITGLVIVGSAALFIVGTAALLPIIIGASAVPDFVGELSRGFTSPGYLASFALYFILGYLFYAAVLVGVGATANTSKEAENLLVPVILPVLIPMFLLASTEDPNSIVPRVLSYIPPFTPFAMLYRITGPPPLWEYALTTLLLVAAIVGAFWAAAKIFRIGILMTGKRPSLWQIATWLRSPDSVSPSPASGATDTALGEQ